MKTKTAVILALVAALALCSCAQGASPTQVNNSPVSASTTSADGLSLILGLNYDTFHPGDEVSVTVEEFNTLDKANKVNAANKWAYPGLTIGPVGLLNSVDGVAIFDGHVTSSELGTAIRLTLYDPNAFIVPPAIFATTAYEFKAKSEICDAYQDANKIIPDMSTKAVVAVNGYWNDSQPAGFAAFSPGEYTVVAGDEWGKLVFLYFNIESGTPASPPVQIVSLTGPVPPYNPGGPTVAITIKNIGSTPIATMNAALKTDVPHPFNLLTSWSPLLPGQAVNSTVFNLIGPVAGTFSNDVPYPVTVSGTLQDGTVFNYTFMMKIALPAG